MRVLFVRFKIFLIMFVCEYVWLCACTCKYYCAQRPSVSEPLALELQAVVSLSPAPCFVVVFGDSVP